MARTRADADLYSNEDLESIHVKLPESIAKAARLQAVEERRSVAVIIREWVVAGYSAKPKKKK